MITTHIYFATCHNPWPWFRQTPGNDGAWGDLQFHLEGETEAADWLVVYDDLSDCVQTRVPLPRRILFVTEPPGIKVYPTAYLDQFGIVVCPFVVERFRRRLIRQQTALPWQYGVDLKDDNITSAGMTSAQCWRDLAADKPKSKQMSVICSNLALLPQHRQRLSFVERIQRRLGDSIDVFGRGINPIDDKRDAIAPYRYHIVLENNLIDHFWTEKLADAFIGDAYPVFYGCRNAGDYFDERGFHQIDIGNPDRAIDQIKQIMESNIWENSRAFIRENRRRVMTEHNLFAVVAKIISLCDQKTHAAARIAPVALRAARTGRLSIGRRFYRFLVDSI
jgi:hypothetical protein